MKLTHTRILKKNSGMTLIELTVVILVLLALIAVLFVGARAYMKASDKTACLMNQRNIQQACRSFINLNRGAQYVTEDDIYGPDNFIAAIPSCKGEEFHIPTVKTDWPTGRVFSPCPSGTADHTPDEDSLASW